MSFKTTCFNRYIVECKYWTGRNIVWFCSSFNRYIVECKYEEDYSCGEFESFNRYIVECKWKRWRRWRESREVLIDT